MLQSELRALAQNSPFFSVTRLCILAGLREDLYTNISGCRVVRCQMMNDSNGFRIFPEADQVSWTLEELE